jgi:predicted permease
MAPFLRRLWYWLRRSRQDADLREEMETHRALRQARFERDGLASADAVSASRRALGNTALSREDAHEVWGSRAWDELVEDVGAGVRSLARHPLVTLAIVASLAIGAGGVTAAFALVKGILLDPRPYPNPDRLVMVWTTTPDRHDERALATVPEVRAWQLRAHSFSALATFGSVGANLSADASGRPPAEIAVQRVTASLFEVLGVEPFLGRTFTADEDRIDGAMTVLVISQDLWERRFARDSGVINRVVRVDGRPVRIVGVLPHGTALAARVDGWAPVAWSHTVVEGSARGWPVVGRLKAGVTMAEAAREVDDILADVASRGEAPRRARLQPLGAALSSGLVRPLILLGAMAAIVLVVAGANVVGLLLARTASRRAELAVRAALGAGRRRLVRQVLAEVALIAAAGATGAAGVAWCTLRLIVATSPMPLPRADHLGIDIGVLACAAVVSALAAFVAGIYPARSASRTDAIDAAATSTARASDPGGVRRLRRALATTQIAFAAVLLIGAGLLARTAQHLLAADLRGDPRGVISFGMRFFPVQYATRVGSHDGFPLMRIHASVAEMSHAIRQRMADLPGVESVAVANHEPFSGGGAPMPFVFETPGASVAPPTALRRALSEIITPGYFATLKIPIVRGRDFTDRDAASSPWVAIVNETTARNLAPDGNPIGRHLTFTLVDDERPREIVGVAADVRASPAAPSPAPTVYTPLDQQPAHSRAPYEGERLLLTFMARTTGDPQAIAPAVRRLVSTIDPDRAPVEARPLDEAVAARLAVREYLARLATAFAVVATLLAAVGLSGVISHAMAQRTKEIGIHVALGAGPAAVWRLAAGEVRGPLALGLLAGLVIAALLTRLIAGLLWGVAPTDVTTYGGVTLLLVVVVAAATSLPVRRAMRTATSTALRNE